MTGGVTKFRGRHKWFKAGAVRLTLALVLGAASSPWMATVACAQRADDPAAMSIIARDALFHPPVARNGMVAAEERTAAQNADP